MKLYTVISTIALEHYAHPKKDTSALFHDMYTLVKVGINREEALQLFYLEKPEVFFADSSSALEYAKNVNANSPPYRFFTQTGIHPVKGFVPSNDAELNFNYNGAVKMRKCITDIVYQVEVEPKFTIGKGNRLIKNSFVFATDEDRSHLTLESAETKSHIYATDKFARKKRLPLIRDKIDPEHSGIEACCHCSLM